MNTFRRFIPALMLGLTMTIAGAGFAQNASQSGDQKKMESCCCCGDSCDMKSGSMKNHTMAGNKHDCCGDSCAMKDGAKTGAADKHECCCGGDSCAMMKKDGKQNHTAMTADKDACCCGDSCNMKHDGQMNMTMKHDASADKQSCCGGSCDTPDLKRKDAKQKP